MKFDQLNYFIHVAKHEHLGKAARRVGLSPSAISHSLASLEEELGRELFSRDGKRLRLTNHGRILAKRAESILNQVALLKDEMTADDVSWEGTLRMGAPSGLAADALVEGFVTLRQLYPKINAAQRNLRSPEVTRLIAEGELDFGLGMTPKAHPAVERQVICEGHVLVCVRKQHPILKLPAKDRLAALRNYPVAGPVPVGGQPVIDECVATPYMHTPGVCDHYFDSYDIAIAFMTRTDAWSFLPDWAIKGSHGSVVTLGNTPVIERYTLCALWPKERGLSRPLRALVGFLEAQVKPGNPRARKAPEAN